MTAHLDGEAVGNDAGSDYTVFGKFLDAPEAEPEDLQETPEEASEDSGEPEEAEVEDTEAEEATEQAEPDEDPQPEAIEPPHSWSKEDKAFFQSLPPEAQRVIAEQEGQRDAFLSQRAEALANERKAIEAQKAEVEQARREYMERLSALQINLPEPPDASLIDSDPVEYMRQRDAYERAQMQAKKIAEEREKLAREEAERQQAAYQEFVKQQADELADLIPEYRDEKTRPQFQKDIAQYALANGYTREQLAWATARDVQTLNKARLYDAMMAAKKEVPEKLKNVPKVTKPGQRADKGEIAQKQREERMAKLRKTGSLDDAAQVFKSLL